MRHQGYLSAPSFAPEAQHLAQVGRDVLEVELCTIVDIMHNLKIFLVYSLFFFVFTHWLCS